MGSHITPELLIVKSTKSHYTSVLASGDASLLRLSDALVLGQFSMARAAAGIPAAPGRKVLTSPHSAVARLKQIFSDG